VALTPQPGQLGRWPSIYSALCEIVLTYGVHEPTGGGSRSILLSQVRPLLEQHWHTSFDESALGFRNEEGTYLRLKKMKHLLHAVLKWRDERVAWKRNTGSAATAVDQALAPILQLVPSKTHNDLVLRLVDGGLERADFASRAQLSCVAEASRPQLTTAFATSGGEPSTDDLFRELEGLRAENASLRRSKMMAESSCAEELAPFAAPSLDDCILAIPQLPADVFDDPFEPPPEAHAWVQHQALNFAQKTSTDASTDAGSECSLDLRSVSSRTLASEAASGVVTPVQPTLVPVWVPMLPTSAGFVDVSVIPHGIVQRGRTQFEVTSE